MQKAIGSRPCSRLLPVNVLSQLSRRARISSLLADRLTCPPPRRHPTPFYLVITCEPSHVFFFAAAPGPFLSLSLSVVRGDPARDRAPAHDRELLEEVAARVCGRPLDLPHVLPPACEQPRLDSRVGLRPLRSARAAPHPHADPRDRRALGALLRGGARDVRGRQRAVSVRTCVRRVCRVDQGCLSRL